MTFYQFRCKVTHYSRYGLFGYVVVTGILWCVAPGRAMINNFGQHYVAKQDGYFEDLANQPSVDNWQVFEDIGNISRHHRYAQLKNQLWSTLITTNPTKLDKSQSRWANKNKRDIQIQLQLADVYDRQGEFEKSYRVLAKLATKIPDHQKLLAAYQQAQHALHQGSIEARAKNTLDDYYADL